MEKGIKNRIILILGILILMLVLIAFRSCVDMRRYKQARDKETVMRFELEDKINKFIGEKTTVETKLTSLSQELEKEKIAHTLTREALEEEQLVSQALKEELAKTTKLKETLEEDLKEVLVANETEK